MKRISVLFILAAGILWGCMGFFVRTLEGIGLSSFQTAAIRLVISSAAFFVMGTVKGKDCLKIKLRDIPLLFCTGFFGIMLVTVTYFLSIKYSSLSVAAILLYTAPAFVMLASVILFHEKFGRAKLFSLLSAFAGLLFVSGVFGGDANVTVVGVIFGLLSGLTYGSYSIFCTYALKKYGSFTVSAWAFAFAAFCRCARNYIKDFDVAVYSDLCCAFGRNGDSDRFSAVFALYGGTFENRSVKSRDNRVCRTADCNRAGIYRL